MIRAAALKSAVSARVSGVSGSGGGGDTEAGIFFGKFVRLRFLKRAMGFVEPERKEKGLRPCALQKIDGCFRGITVGRDRPDNWCPARKGHESYPTDLVSIAVCSTPDTAVRYPCALSRWIICCV